MQSFKDFTGKTIAKVDDDSQNAVVFHFTDGTQCQVFAECGSNGYDIPFFDFSNNPEN